MTVGWQKGINDQYDEDDELKSAHDHKHLAIDAGEDSGKFLFNIVHCARCGEDHAKVERFEFKRPVTCECGQVNTHYCLCPTTGEPILARIISS